MSRVKWVIADLDGVLAQIGPMRAPLQVTRAWDEFHRIGCAERIHEEARTILNGLLALGVPNVIFTGRTELYRDGTERWLRYMGVRTRQLYMRGATDRRPNTEVKREMYDTFVTQFASPRDILFVMEDRDDLVAMWRGMGLVCLQPRSGPG